MAGRRKVPRQGLSTAAVQGLPRDPDVSCAVGSDIEDASIPGAAAVLGVLIAIACVGLWPSAAPLLCVVVSFAAGLLLVAARASTLPVLGLWMIPLVSLAGGASVALSVGRRTDLEMGDTAS